MRLILISGLFLMLLFMILSFAVVKKKSDTQNQNKDKETSFIATTRAAVDTTDITDTTADTP